MTVVALRKNSAIVQGDIALQVTQFLLDIEIEIASKDGVPSFFPFDAGTIGILGDTKITPTFWGEVHDYFFIKKEVVHAKELIARINVGSTSWTIEVYDQEHLEFIVALHAKLIRCFYVDIYIFVTRLSDDLVL